MISFVLAQIILLLVMNLTILNKEDILNKIFLTRNTQNKNINQSIVENAMIKVPRNLTTSFTWGQ